jgi:hypothetical protein
MRGEKFREASAHASGEVSARVFLVGNHPTSRLRLSRHFLIARPPLLRDERVNESVLEAFGWKWGKESVGGCQCLNVLK